MPLTRNRCVQQMHFRLRQEIGHKGLALTNPHTDELLSKKPQGHMNSTISRS